MGAVGAAGSFEVFAASEETKALAPIFDLRAGRISGGERIAHFSLVAQDAEKVSRSISNLCDASCNLYEFSSGNVILHKVPQAADSVLTGLSHGIYRATGNYNLCCNPQGG